MKHDDKLEKVEERTDVTYETPRIEDYGTLAELTAGKEGDNWDLFSREGWGGYS